MTKNLGLMTIVLLVTAASAAQQPTAAAPRICKKGEYCVVRDTSSKSCWVQEATELPRLGDDFKGPYKSRADARKAMCALYDPQIEDVTKCWTVNPNDACKSRQR